MKKKKRRVDFTGKTMQGHTTPHEELYELDGVQYKITAEKAQGNFWGKWYCTKCEERGGSSKACSSEKEAITYAITNLRMHHVLKKHHLCRNAKRSAANN